MKHLKENSGFSKFKIIKKINKYVDFFITKIHLLIHEKKFHYEDTMLKYMLNCNNSDTLIVVFSACTRKGLKARYNYVRTLRNVNSNQLFILDDFAKDQRGGYYIGSNFQFNEQEATKKLITSIIEKTNSKRIIFCGSSKGAWAALNFGLQFNNVYVIAGAPQYMLGTYLFNDNSLITLEHIIGEITDEKIKYLDEYLKNRICSNKLEIRPKIYLHFSNQEHTYFEHIQYMVDDLVEHEYEVNYDIENYKQHSDISYYFPDFLVKSIGKIMNES